jgi:hypothetical protein
MAREMFVAADSETTHCSTILLYQSLQEQTRKGNKEAKATTTTTMTTTTTTTTSSRSSEQRLQL